MFRFFAALMVLSGAFLIGRAGVITRKNAANRLRHIRAGLCSIENDIRALLLPLPDAFLRASTYDDFFSISANNMLSMDAESAVSDAAAKTMKEKEVAEALCAFSQGLSAVDAAGQLQNIRLCYARMDDILTAWEADRKQKDRLQSSIAIMAGLAVVIVFI